MDQFPDRQHVWLRSLVHDTYLHADEDGHGVSLSRHRASMNAAWVVHLYGDDQHVLLHSAAYGRYLAATGVSAPPGCRGFRVEQRNYDELQGEDIRWHVLRTSGGNIVLRHAAGSRYGYLRANGRYLPWNADVVTVEDFNFSTMMEWAVEPIPTTERVPRLPRPNILRLRLPALLQSREVVLTRNGEDVSFVFTGRSVFHLRNEVARRLGNMGDDTNNLVMYVRAGTFGRFTPLVVDLPPSRQTLAITAEPPANVEVRYPYFDAE